MRMETQRVQHRLNIAVEPELYRQLKQVARAEDRTITAIVTRALASYARKALA